MGERNFDGARKRLEVATTDLVETRSNIERDLQRMREIVPETVDPDKRREGEMLISLAESWVTATDSLLGDRP